MVSKVFIVTSFLICLSMGHTSAVERISGVWLDDGFGKTVKAEIEPEDAHTLTRHMLQVLGLPEPPRHIRHHYPRGSAPTFLKSIYESLDEHGHSQAPHLDDVHRAKVAAADTIITFVNKAHPPGGRPKRKGNRVLYFNVDDVLLEHSLLAAELRLHRSSKTSLITEPLRLHVYLLTDRGESQIATVRLPAEGWFSVNVTNAALSWIIFPQTNLGLRLSITRMELKHEVQFHEAGVSGAHDEEDLRPFLVGFFAFPTHQSRRRLPRSVTPVAPKTIAKNPYSMMQSDSPDDDDDSLCQKRHLHVSFRDLGWERWVIAPEGYDANFCKGKCQFPLQADSNATNHAIVQTLVMTIHKVKANSEPPPAACCAPTELTTISVLYYDYSSNVVLKKYPKMIVKSCGCL